MVESPTPIEEVASGRITNGSASIVEEITPLPGEPPTEPEPEAPRFAGEHDSEPAPLDAPPTSGPLTGSYRPSSLRLIDEAVAAAQAIDPSLFDSLEDPPDPTPLARVQLKKVPVEPARSRPSSVPPAIRAAISTMEIAVPEPEAALDRASDDVEGKIEREADASIARLSWQADDIDGITYLDEPLAPGTIAENFVREVVDDYDFRGSVIRSLHGPPPTSRRRPRELPQHPLSIGSYGQ
jgi:hypothetical protein